MAAHVLRDLGDGRGCLQLAGELSVANIGELRQALLEALESHARVEVDGSAVADCDLAALQVLCSAHRTAVARGLHLTLCGIDGGPWPALLDAAGFRRHVACSLSRQPHDCIWICDCARP